MGALEFHGKQWLAIEPSSDFNPQPYATVEALCQLLDAGQHPTVFCRPACGIWERPYVLWRLGFYADQRKPEFQILFKGDSAPTTVRSESPVSLHEVIHLAGVYDGESVTLYVNGKVAASEMRTGIPAESEQRIVVGGRSATDEGGYFVGRLFDLRYWRVARAAEEISFWSNRTLPVPVPDGCVGYWHTEPRLPLELIQRFSERGFSSKECSFFNFLHVYSDEYRKSADQLLEAKTKRLYPPEIHAVIVIKASDGYLAFYESGPAEYLANFRVEPELVQQGSLVVFDQPGLSVSETIQGSTYNAIKLSISGIGGSQDAIQRFPEDNPNATDWMLSKELRSYSIEPPRLHILVVPTHQDDTYRRGRIRVVAPIVEVDAGKLARSFSWLFADIWLGELGWDHNVKGFAEVLAYNDALAVQQLSSLVYPPGRVIEIDSKQPLLPIEDRLREFKALVEREDVDEVRDVLPFLARPENWFLLSPTCEHVWSEKMLGNKWRVDFLVREPGNQYTAIEIESPTKRLYKTGRDVEPYAEFHHAEQQVRDYCNFIDRNRDYVEREEGLTGIYKPRGIVVIGRRATLSPEGARKLEERNADSTRYTIKTFDDLIDQARALVQRLKMFA